MFEHFQIQLLEYSIQPTNVLLHKFIVQVT